MTCPTCHYCKTISTDIISPDGFGLVAVERLRCQVRYEWMDDDDTCEDFQPKDTTHDTP